MTVVVHVRALPRPLPGDAALLDGRETERAARFVAERDRDRYVAAHAWLRRLLAEATGQEAAALEITVDGRGRPALAADGPAFSLAHTGDVVAVAVADGAAVGVDVETVPDAVDRDAAALVLGPGELASVDEGGPLAFTVAWTRKEAWVKATGAGLHEGLRVVDLTGAVAPDGMAVRTFPPLRVDGVDVVVSVAGPDPLDDARLQVVP